MNGIGWSRNLLNTGERGCIWWSKIDGSKNQLYLVLNWDSLRAGKLILNINNGIEFKAWEKVSIVGLKKKIALLWDKILMETIELLEKLADNCFCFVQVRAYKDWWFGVFLKKMPKR